MIVITGTPGVGKTTVAKALASRLGAIYVSVAELVKKEKLFLEVDEERDTLVADLERLSERVRGIILDASQDVVVEGHYAQDVVPEGLLTYVFVLRRSPDDLRAKLVERGYEEGKVSENVASEALDVCLMGALKRHGAGVVDEVDTTYMVVEEVVEEVLSVLDGRRKPKTGKVDWLGKLEEEGRLEKFLSKLNWL